MRLIEKKNDSVGVTVDNGAVLNRASVQGQNGALYGFMLTLNGGDLMVTKGRLIVQGFTFEVLETEVLFDIGAYTPSNANEQSLYLKISWDAAARDATYELVVKPSAEYVAQVSIEQNIEGSYYFKLCTFAKAGATITSFTSKVAAVYLNGGNSGSGTGLVVPQPVLALVNARREHSGVPSVKEGYLMIGNADEFATLNNSYTVKFLFYRKLENAHYRSGRGTGLNLYTKKSQWVRSFNPTKIVDSAVPFSQVPYNNLFVAPITDGAVRKLAICYVNEIIDAWFRDIGDPNGSVTASTLPGNIRATRSKRVKVTDSVPARYHYKYNYLEFAYKAAAYNQAGEIVGESAISNPIFIKPNPNAASMEAGGLTIIVG